jgi:exodeoxyribonuclease-3
MPTPLKLATWNINSVRLRIGLVRRFLEEQAPDVLCLQETKSPDEHFPHEAFEELGYEHRAIRGEKGYNGVAIVSRIPFTDSGHRLFCGREDCRHIAVTLPGNVELHNFYVPAGGDEPDPKANPKFAHKLDFVREMTDWANEVKAPRAKRILVGDLNIAPLENDVWSHKQLLKVVSHTPIEVELLAEAQEAHDWVDAVRRFFPEDEKLYSWWSYRAKDWLAADRGRRLDHVWVTPALEQGLQRAEILKPARGWAPKPSDHAPVIVEMEI